MKLIDILKEIATSHYTLSSPDVDKKGLGVVDVYYYFTTDSKREYYVLFRSLWDGSFKEPDQKYNWKTKLTFMPKNPFDTEDGMDIGGENFPKILGTVIEALKKYISTYKPEYIYWSGTPSEKERGADTTKRQRIYNAILDRGAAKIPGYKSKIGDESSLLYDGEIPIKDSHPIFKYPKKPTVRGNKEDDEIHNKKMSRFNLSQSK